MFSFNSHDIQQDLSRELSENLDWNVGVFKTFKYDANVVALAVDPVSSLLVVGTAQGEIRILGGPLVDIRFSLPDPSTRVKFLQFAPFVSKLVCVDTNDQVYVWTLASHTQPKLQATFKSNNLVISPSHSHAFIILQSGKIKTYDLLCLRFSPYDVANQWTLHQEKDPLSGRDGHREVDSHVPMEVAVHPRNLGTTFIAYAGGVALYDIPERKTSRVYELVLSPGAPGGTDLVTQDLLNPRRPPVTCIAIHPAGHLFAVGHADGCIAFWAVDDEDRPLLVKTLDDSDVNVPSEKIFDALLASNLPPEPDLSSPPSSREAIFKLAWAGFPNSSDPRGGDTALVILGGLRSDDIPGINILWLPPFNPPAPPPNVGPQSLHPSLRTAIRQSLLPMKSVFLPTSGIIQDFLLVPKDNPHFSGNWDPKAIVLLSEATDKSRTVEAYQFPINPSGSHPNVANTVPNAGTTSEEIVEDLASTLESLQFDHPQRLNLPPSFWAGDGAVIDGHLVICEREAYESLTSVSKVESGLQFHGGTTWVNEDSTSSDIKFARYQPRRILVTRHQDLTVRFQDLSAQNLVNSSAEALNRDFPDAIYSLTIDPFSVFADASVSALDLPALSRETRLDRVYLAQESLECYLMFQTGEVIIFTLTNGDEKKLASRVIDDSELVPIDHIVVESGRKFRPSLLLSANIGAVVGFAASEIGFFATSYEDGSLLVVDMRGPRVILRSRPPAKKKGLHIHSEDRDPIVHLSWSVCKLDSDPIPRIRLLGTKTSGETKIYTLNHSPATGLWSIDSEPKVMETAANPVPRGSTFVIDARSGARCKADRAGLAVALNPPKPAPVGKEDGSTGHCILVTAGGKGVRCNLDVDGDRIAKADWPSKVGTVECVEVVERNGSHALVAITSKGEALIYSLPALELLHTLHLPETSTGSIWLNSVGDFIEHTIHQPTGTVMQTTFGSLFDIRCSFYHTQPEIDFLIRQDTGEKGVIPPQPQPVSIGPVSTLGSWVGSFVGPRSITGEQIDSLLAGPDRPIPKQTVTKPSGSGKASSSSSRSPERSAKPSLGGQDQRGSLQERLTSALSERGEMLGNLEEQVKSLEEGSRSMVNQAKRLAAEQTARRWFPF
ncbi:hypothetical protein JAAARDRAFT_119208 [Jaapia argillacea MUCL 33604]|uniref:Lethal giant larvae (Lgl)-like C-terminal domain-containing protein n=1 Tax=Jaapia argillacea MUCL 33604 TaxID=933084 RepID=A0A067Q7W1_9AGAM|nr:hypothetical protein JAAARDRAFT_119208 [Jaapia argillacea MUCL 33604]